MFNTDYLTVLQIHQSRVREAEKRRIMHELAHAAEDPMMRATQADLLREIRQWMQARAEQHEEISDVRRAHAV